MKIPTHIQRIEVYYDGECSMCCTFKNWLVRQEHAVEVDVLPYQSLRAQEVFPDIAKWEPWREMLVRTDTGEIYRGAQGWVLCLYSCANYQRMAHRLASPVLLPLAEKTCHLLSARRHDISKVFFREKDRELAAKLHCVNEQGCEEGFLNRRDIPDGVI